MDSWFCKECDEVHQEGQTCAKPPLSAEVPGYAIDKNGIQICPGDTLKIFHFIGARKKRHYMYKFVESVDGKLLVINHLSGGLSQKYTINNSGVYLGIEVVQGYYGVRPGLDFSNRPRIKA